jgi:hypothetical protein
MEKIVWVVSAFSILFFVHFAHAQFGKGAMPKFYSDFKPVVGGWSEYQMTSKSESPVKMKMAIVGKEGDAYWYETVVEDKKAGKTVTKMLVSGNPDDQNSVKRIIVKTGNESAMEMPIQMWKQGSKPQESKGKPIDKGKETIKVPAGTFATQHFQYQESGSLVDTWIYKDVSPYGLIKSQSKDFEMVLTEYGTGAKSLITETPRKFEMSQMGKRPLNSKVSDKEKDDDDDDNGNNDENNDDKNDDDNESDDEG